MPPSALLAMVGPRVANHVLHTLHDAFPGPVPALADARELRRTARWTSSLTGEPGRPWTRSTSAILEALADEAGTCSTRGSSASAGEIDACLILGAGFPFFRGGLTKYLDQEGVSTRVSGRPLGGS